MEFLDYFGDSAPKSELMNFVRKEVLKAYPVANECIAYQMPAWKEKESNAPLLYIGAMKKHLGLYPLPTYIQSRAEDLQIERLKFSKGAIQVPYDYPREKLSKLIVDIIHFNLENNIKN